MGLALALREWSAVIDAMGKGQQSVMVRSYPPRAGKFLLYPTFSFYSSEKSNLQKFDRKFQPQFREFAKNSAEETLAKARNLQVEIQYFAELDDAIPIENIKLWHTLAPYFIWSSEHVAHYASNSSLLWILRIHRLRNPVIIERKAGGGPPTFYKHPDEISIVGSQPILSNAAFFELREKVLGICSR